MFEFKHILLDNWKHHIVNMFASPLDHALDWEYLHLPETARAAWSAANEARIKKSYDYKMRTVFLHGKFNPDSDHKRYDFHQIVHGDERKVKGISVPLSNQEKHLVRKMSLKPWPGLDDHNRESWEKTSEYTQCAAKRRKTTLSAKSLSEIDYFRTCRLLSVPFDRDEVAHIKVLTEKFVA